VVRTEYSWLTSEELVIVASNKKSATPLEIELAQRLAVYIEDQKGADECPPQKDE
jgi:hypothetical protein